MSTVTNFLILLIVTILSVITAAYIYMTRKFKHWKKKGIMEIKPTAFVGNMGDCLMMKTSPGLLFKQVYNEGKGLPYVGMYIFDKPTLLLRDPEIIKRVLIKDFNYFSDRFSRASESDKIGNSNLFMIKNPDWKTVRAKLTPIFTSGRLKKMFILMEEVGKDLDVYLASEIPEVGTLEMKEVCAKFTTDMIGTTAYGLKVNSLNNPDAEFRKCGRQIFTYNIRRSIEFTTIFFMPELVETLGFQVFSKESTIFLRNAFWDTINERIKSGIKRNDLIDLLIELKQSYENDPEQNNGYKFDGDNLVSQAAIFFTGGFETSSTTMSFTLYELALHTEIQKKLRLEIDEALKANGGKITYDMVMTLPYLDMVISETLRFYPILPFLDRVALQDYKIPETNLIVEKGTPIIIPMLGLHQDSQYFSHPEIYDPERFSEQNKKSLTPCVYIPFGEGPHICIGQRLGLLQSKLGIIHIISKYEISINKKTPVPIELDPKAFLTSAIGGLHLNLKKITTAAG
ncbi:cytochrome P450 6k1-like isoform X2 [Leptopilina boulardi]|uniref:cytochrome P450 6k1-like isoform X2 n=1 Tax=Leptopilina boulardi TaxID=63433 RepID=UPI0021F682B9|nr:cytochrome P450 6k1-like isoform X2 [Leptopilina boulardi]